MAVTNNYYQQQQRKQQTQQAQPYTGLAGVSQNTAQQLGNLQQGYQPSEQVLKAQQNLQNVQNQKPGSFQSKYTPQLENILQQITNPGEFKYEFNGDNLFKNYADLYTQKGKQASMDAMGQAAGLTGGYGNSYAQQVGQQAYQQNLLPLYDKGLELRDRAYGEYQDRLANQKDAYGLAAQREETEYGRYRDITEDWKQAEEQAYQRLKDADTSDYNKYQVMLGYYQGLAELENQDYRNEQEQQEAIRQFNETMAENIREFDADLAEKIRSNKAAEDYQNRSLDETIRSNKASEDYNDRALAETIRSNMAGEEYDKNYLDYLYAALDAQYGDHGEGSSGSSGSGGGGGAETPAAETPAAETGGGQKTFLQQTQDIVKGAVSNYAKDYASKALAGNTPAATTTAKTATTVGNAVANALSSITSNIKTGAQRVNESTANVLKFWK